MIETFFKLMIGHAVADFWAQSAELRKGKGRIPPLVMADGVAVWPYALTAHALIHGGAVWLLTGNVWLGAAEFVCHWGIDFGRSGRWYSTHADQAAHVACKILWSALA